MRQPSDNNIVLRLVNLTKIYGEGTTAVRAVDDVGLEVARGKILLIMGPSGSGKTTLLSMAGGLLRPTSGKVFINRHEITALNEDQLPDLRLQNIGFVFQSFNLLSALTALENVQIVCELHGQHKNTARQHSAGILELLGLGARLDFRPDKLSGGEKQRVSIARALVNDPLLLLADEPTANLDSRNGHEVMELLQGIAKKDQRTVVIVSHDQRIRSFADQVMWLEDGKFKQLSQMVRDPVCGMEVEKDLAFSAMLKGQQYYFCSQGCKQEFTQKKHSVLKL